MPDYSAVLDRIATALEHLSAQYAASVSPWVTLFSGAFLGALVTFSGQWIFWTRQQSVVNRRKREFVGKMLKDELSDRLPNQIGSELIGLFQEPIAIDRVRHFCNNVTMSDNDLPICKMAYENALELNVFLNTRLVSHIIYIHVLMKDLCDAQTQLRAKLEKYDAVNDANNKNEMEETVVTNYSSLKKQFVDKIFEQSRIVLTEIGK